MTRTSPLSQALAKADQEYRPSRFEAAPDETTRPVAMSVILKFAQQSESTQQIFLQMPSHEDLQVDDEVEVPETGEEAQ